LRSGRRSAHPLDRGRSATPLDGDPHSPEEALGLASTNLLLLPAAGAFAGGYDIGTVVWRVNGFTGDGVSSIIVGYLNPGVDGLGGAGFNNISASALFRGATAADATPEPGTAALLGLGLVLAGRRRRV